mmetsp:Transcript_70934/g.189264  ORF Transcript_70934/g.189264 Transcript_70934/m.189264 type:complete len:309 (-) Transcript_70934:39-965(-)
MVVHRSLPIGNRFVHLFGVQGYNSAVGSHEVFKMISSTRVGAVLMESFVVDGQPIQPGAVVPYHKTLPSTGLQRAMELVAEPSFQEAWTAEAVAALTALRVQSQVVFADRLHTQSFDRLIERRSLDEMRHSLIHATEAVASAMESTPGWSLPPQNCVCPLFPELWEERHKVMAHFAAQQAAAGADVGVVVGSQHIDGVAEYLNQDFDESLLATPTGRDGNDPVEWEKRAAVGAFLTTTRIFPPWCALPNEQEMTQDQLDLVKRFYPKYRNAFVGRLAGFQQRLAGISDGTQILGLGHLAGLCKQLDQQ